MKKRRGFLLYLLVIAMLLTMTSPAVLFAAEVTAEEDTEEYAEEIPEAYDWTIETNELKKWPRGPRVEAEGATVMDLDTGAFLYSKNAEAKMYPASITKIMTMLVALEHISDGELDKKVKASESALTPIDSDSSQIWLSVGEKITVRSALYAIMLASANDAANVIAEYVGGSIDVFVQMMNDKAKELGCNKIALGHHYDDVIETILMGMLYGAQIQTMMPKLHSTNFEGMELIRPLYLIREADIIHWRDYNNLAFIQCACRLTESCASCGGTEKGSKRGEIKQLIKDLTKVSPYIEKNIFRSVENVNLDTVIAYKQYGVKHNFLERYDEMGRLNGASGSQTADNKEME